MIYLNDSLLVLKKTNRNVSVLPQSSSVYTPTDYMVKFIGLSKDYSTNTNKIFFLN